jgi:hypothetical protein
MSRPRRHKPVRVLVLQHDRQGGLGAYERVLSQRKVEVHVAELDSSGRLPDWRAFDAVMALGGQASIAGSPPAWLAAERQYVREAVMSGARIGAFALALSCWQQAWVHAYTRAQDPKSGSIPSSSRTPAATTLFFRRYPPSSVCSSGTRTVSTSHAEPSCSQVHWPIQPGIPLGRARLWDPVPSRDLAGDGPYLGRIACLRGSARGGVGRNRLAHLLVELEAHSTALGAIAASLLGRWLTLAEGCRRRSAA